ncbi:hypothetical protein STEG23_012390, partial [Scotinomys teguina]
GKPKMVPFASHQAMLKGGGEKREQKKRQKPSFCSLSVANSTLLPTGPSIVTPPKDIWNVTGAKVYLSCEVIGIPTPVLIWNKVKRDHSGVQRTELLPGDRENLAIQTRGGPEKHEVTGWVLVKVLSYKPANYNSLCS